MHCPRGLLVDFVVTGCLSMEIIDHGGCFAFDWSVALR